MKTAKELYIDEDYTEDDTYHHFSGDYQPMLNEFGEILLQVDDNSYQGDTRVLYRDGTRYGWLNFGWGSCSGCDALQACYTIEEIQSLMDSLYSEITWFDSPTGALEFFKTHDWEGDYSHGYQEQARFITEATVILEAEVAKR